jgi:serine-type D-Ala-D-Ala carboxypeptidase/endopeptidase (penicillin-binding protein 4)
LTQLPLKQLENFIFLYLEQGILQSKPSLSLLGEDNMTRQPRFGLICSTLALAVSALLLPQSQAFARPRGAIELFPNGQPITPNSDNPYPNGNGSGSGNGNSRYPSPYLCPADLQGAINQIVDSPYFASARWGILVETLKSPTTLYSRNADSLLIPASNVKLLTTAAALQTLYRQNLDLAALTYRIEVVNRESDNYVADALLRQIGGVQSVQVALLPLGIDPQGYRQVDGSGLSRRNLAKPTTLVAVLRAMHSSDARDLFRSSLPVAGYTGTLKNRFRGTAVQGRLRAKTGTLDGVRALSGYLENDSYGTLLVSLVINQPGQSGEMLLWGIDSVIHQLSRLTSCQPSNPVYPNQLPNTPTGPQIPGRVR